MIKIHIQVCSLIMMFFPKISLAISRATFGRSKNRSNCIVYTCIALRTYVAICIWASGQWSVKKHIFPEQHILCICMFLFDIYVHIFQLRGYNKLRQWMFCLRDDFACLKQIFDQTHYSNLISVMIKSEYIYISAIFYNLCSHRLEIQIDLSQHIICLYIK